MVFPPKDLDTTALPPLALRPKVLLHVLHRLRQHGPSSPTLFTDLTIALRLLIALTSSTRDLLPLTIVLYLNNRGDNLPLPILLYTTLAYPHHHPALSALWDAQLDRQVELEDAIRAQVIPGLVSRLQLAPGLGTLNAAAQTLLTMSRASESLLALVLSEADYVLPALRAVYDGLDKEKGSSSGGDNGREKGKGKESARVKGDVLALCMALLGAVQSEGVKSGLRRLISAGAAGTGASGAGVGAAIENAGLFEQSLSGAVANLEKGRVDEGSKRLMQDIRDEHARDDHVRHIIPNSTRDSPILQLSMRILRFSARPIDPDPLPSPPTPPIARRSAPPRTSTRRILSSSRIIIEQAGDPPLIARGSGGSSARSYPVGRVDPAA